MADNSATAAYRGQNGIPVTTDGPDPVVIEWTQRAAAATGADPKALLATELQETGARRGEVGDAGTSFGPFQHHRGGALGTHNQAWANSYDAILERARQFARYGVRGGKGAAAVQRPRDPALYAKGVDANLRKAEELLGLKSGALGTSAAPRTPPAPTRRAAQQTNDDADIGHGLLDSLLATNAHIAGIPSAPYDPNASTLQRTLSANAALAGIEAPVLPAVTPTPTTTPAPRVPQRTPRMPGAPAGPTGPIGKVIRIKGAPHLIGLPYQGTHTLYGNWESDNAIDIQLPSGTPVYAAADGTIGSQIGAIGGNDPHMAGQRLHLKIAGNELYYQHLKSIAVKAGQHVKAGQLLGYTGALNHLHLGVKNGKPQTYA